MRVSKLFWVNCHFNYRPLAEDVRKVNNLNEKQEAVYIYTTIMYYNVRMSSLVKWIQSVVINNASIIVTIALCKIVVLTLAHIICAILT